MYSLDLEPGQMLDRICRCLGYTQADELVLSEHVGLLRNQEEQLQAQLQQFIEQHADIAPDSLTALVDRQEGTQCCAQRLRDEYGTRLLRLPVDPSYADATIQTGIQHFQAGISMMWVSGILEIYFEHAESILNASDLPQDKKWQLVHALRKRYQVDKLLQVEGYRAASQHSVDLKTAQHSHLYRLYSTLSLVSMAILHADDVKTLFQSFCDAAVQHGFAYAWVASSGEAKEQVQFTAFSCRNHSSFPFQMQVSEKEGPFGDGPTGCALRLGTIQVVNHIAKDTSLRPWHALFEQHGIRSLVTMPLKLDGKTSACFSLYAEEADYFGEEELALVAIMAREISHALERLTALANNNIILEQLVWQRQHDPLTRLPLRELMLAHINQLLLSQQSRDNKLAIVSIALDNFSEINNRLGHLVGDAVLCMLSDLLQERVGKQGFLARLGGNHFAIATNQPGWVLPLLESILKRIAAPHRLHSQTIQTTASMGIVMANSSNNAEKLLQQSSLALNRARLDGGNQFYFFDSKLDATIIQQQQTRDEIRQALTRREIIAYFQPKIDLLTGTVIGAEALARWQKGKAVIEAEAFLPAIQDTELLPRLDWHMLSSVAELLSTPCALSRQLFSISVNLSQQTLSAADFVAKLMALINRYGLLPARIEIEVAEGISHQDSKIITTLENCRKQGFHIALDDFGSGAASLTQLQEMPVDMIKIHQDFIRQLPEQETHQALIGSLVTFANLSGCDLFAEGIETLDIWKQVAQLGCHLGQGYAIARPMSAADFETWLPEWGATESSPIQVDTSFVS